jgi:hypothetical protein
LTASEFDIVSKKQLIVQNIAAAFPSLVGFFALLPQIEVNLVRNGVVRQASFTRGVTRHNGSKQLLLTLHE